MKPVVRRLIVVGFIAKVAVTAFAAASLFAGKSADAAPRGASAAVAAPAVPAQASEHPSAGADVAGGRIGFFQ